MQDVLVGLMVAVAMLAATVGMALFIKHLGENQR